MQFSRAASHTKADIVEVIVGSAVDANTDNATLCSKLPAAAAFDTPCTGSSTLRVANITILYIAVPVKTPFKNVPAHIV